MANSITWFFACLLILRFRMTTCNTLECNVSTELPTVMDFPTIILETEQWYYSDTNADSYDRKPKFVGRTQLDGNNTVGSFSYKVSRSRTQKVNFAYNGTHICSSAELRYEKDTCWSGSTSGCYNKTNVCDNLCFLSTDYYKRHTLRLFRAYTSSYDIGTWEENDYANLYTMPNKQYTCYHGNDSYKNWDYKDTTPSYPNLKKVQCPTGLRCRISTGKVMYSDPITTYVGCERDENQFDGCDGRCSILEYHRSPGGGSARWVELCKYCCSDDLCNNPYKCKGTECDLHTEIPGKNAGNILSTAVVMNVMVTCSLVFIVH